MIVLTGENSYLLQNDLKKQIDSFVSEYSDMGLERLDGEESGYDRMREAIESLPFLAQKKLVVLYRPSANKEFAEKYANILADTSETLDLIIVEPKLDKRKAYYKFLKKTAEIKLFNELDENSIARWLSQQAESRGGRLSYTDARFLVQRVGMNQQMLSNELDKLLNYETNISRQTIELLTDVTPQSTIFDLLDSAFAGRTKQALDLYGEQRAMKVEPQQILAMLTWQLHIISIVKMAGSKNVDTIAREAKIKPYVVLKTQNLTRRMSLPQIKTLIYKVLEMDIRSKSQAVDVDEALQSFIMNISHI